VTPRPARLIDEAAALLEERGVAGFATRPVCERADVTAPTLRHRFGGADGLNSPAVASVAPGVTSAKAAAAGSKGEEFANFFRDSIRVANT
jgi:DNA-binding transcriptional regulator YbjK